MHNHANTQCLLTSSIIALPATDPVPLLGHLLVIQVQQAQQDSQHEPPPSLVLFEGIPLQGQQRQSEASPQGIRGRKVDLVCGERIECTRVVNKSTGVLIWKDMLCPLIHAEVSTSILNGMLSTSTI